MPRSLKYAGLFILLLLVACQEEEVFVPLVQQETGSTPLPPLALATITPEAEETEMPAEPTEIVEMESPADAHVRFVRARLVGENNWTFAVTVEHPDTGWEDYADGWDVVLPDGTVIKPDPDSPFTRLLLHPHETEQPFTRSQNNVLIPGHITQVMVRAHDLVDGFGGEEIVVDLSADSGPGFEVER